MRYIFLFFIFFIFVKAQVFNVSTSQEFQNALNESSGNLSDDIIILKKGIYSTVDNDTKFMYSDNEQYDLLIKAEDGSLSEDVVLDGNDEHMIMAISNSNNKATITIENISFKNANYKENGGAIAISGSSNVIINNCVFKNNKNCFKNCNVNNVEYEDGGGGAILLKSANLKVMNTIFENNIASGMGGAICYLSGSLSVDNSTFKNNKADIGGGIGTTLAITSINNSTFIENSGYGGGVHADSFDINNSTFIGNEMSGTFNGLGTVDSRISNSVFKDHNNTGVLASGEYGYGRPNSAPIEIINCKFDNNRKGVAFNGTNGKATIINSSFSKSEKALSAREVDMTIVNSIFTQNEISIYNGLGDSMFNIGYTVVKNSTFYDNNGTSVYAYGLILNNIFDNKSDIDIFQTHSDSIIVNNFLVQTNISAWLDGYTYLFQNNIDFGSSDLEENFVLKDDSLLIDSGTEKLDDYLKYFNTLSKDYLYIDINGSKKSGWFRDIGAVESTYSRCVEDIVYALNPTTKRWSEAYNTCDVPQDWLVSQYAPEEFLKIKKEFKYPVLDIDEIKNSIDNRVAGWHLIGTSNDIYDLSILDSIEVAYVFREGGWLVYSPVDTLNDVIENSKMDTFSVIYENEGFWIYKK